MIDTAVLDEVLRGVAASNILRNTRRVQYSEDPDIHVLEGEAVVEGRQVTIQLLLDNSFPLQLPRVRLVPWDALGFIPHVMPDGQVCFTSPEGLVIDRRRPTEVATESLASAIHILSDGVTNRKPGEFVDEFETYWARLPDSTTATSLLEVTDKVEEVAVAYVNRNGHSSVWFGNSELEIESFGGQPLVDGILRQSALYIPLEPGTLITPPRHDTPFWTVAEARDTIVPGLSRENLARLLKLTKKRSRKIDFVIISLRRPSGGATLFGLIYTDLGVPHPLRRSGKAQAVHPLSLSRRDRGFLVERGGGHLSVNKKRVLLVGCGAIGGHLAFELARAGVLDLTLVDADFIMPENTYRHALGRNYWVTPKSIALQTQIEIQLPYVKATAISKQIQDAISDGSVVLSQYDLVLFALGNTAVELEMNELIASIAGGPPALFTWLEPLGLGGHALLTHNGSRRGCLECLYEPDDVDGRLRDRASFAAPRQDFGRALSGCGSLHTPYGSVDALRTTVLATQLAIDTLTGRETGNPLRSWKGDKTLFLSEGFRISPRYAATEESLLAHQYAYARDACPVCGCNSMSSENESVSAQAGET